MPDRDGLTPLHFAVKRNHINLARQILSICPETVNSYDKRGLTPFVLAILIGADQVTHELKFKALIFFLDCRFGFQSPQLKVSFTIRYEWKVFHGGGNCRPCKTAQ